MNLISMNPPIPKVKNLIFDLGGVLYAIDYTAVERGMESLKDPMHVGEGVSYSRGYQDPLFSLLEIGQITPAEFFERMKEKFFLKAEKEEFFQVWNSMLNGLIVGREEMIKELSSNYRLFLLSNTNEIHYQHLLPECEKMFSYFEHCYFSQQVGLRKPDLNIFNKVLAEQNIKPEETLYIEDSLQHIHAAQSLGILTLFVEDETWAEPFKQQFNLN